MGLPGRLFYTPGALSSVGCKSELLNLGVRLLPPILVDLDADVPQEPPLFRHRAYIRLLTVGLRVFAYWPYHFNDDCLLTELKNTLSRTKTCTEITVPSSRLAETCLLRRRRS